MSNYGKYIGLGGEGSSSETPFPQTRSNFKELIHLRSWQASGFVTALYYFSFIVGLLLFISDIVVFTQSLGAGGFFLGLLYGTIKFIAFIIGARIVSEIVLSVFEIRDHIYRIAVNSGPATVVSQAPTTSYQGTYQSQQSYQPPQQPQQPQSYQSQPPQSATSTEFPKYQEPYQGSL